MALLVGQAKTSRNASATMAFQKYRQEASQKDEEVDSRASYVKIAIERLDSRFRAKLHLEVAKSFGVFGPARDSRPEAINDGVEMGKAFVSEGAAGTRRVAASLTSRKWSLKEIENANESMLEGFILSSQGSAAESKKRLIPRGEGWVRHDDVTLVNPQSQVLFMQEGPRAGSYMKQDPSTKKLVDVSEPHVPQESKTSIRGATASWIRRGSKMDRAVLLNDITKIARLALKFPLSFVDLPACAYALFHGLRSAESAQIHTYDTAQLRRLLERTLEALDAEILKSAHAFSGCSAILVLVLGERIVLAGVGDVRAVLLPEKGALQEVLACTGSLDAAELERVSEAHGIFRDGLVYSSIEGVDEAARILAARSSFEVLQVEQGSSLDLKQVRSAYRKLALRVHPDKQNENANTDAFRFAFARLDSSKEALETMLAEDVQSCKEIHKVLSADVHSRLGAAQLLGADPGSPLTEGVIADLEKSSRAQIKRFQKMSQVCPEYDQAVAACHEAVATLKRQCGEEALPRYEALLKEGLSATRALGARDLRWPRPIVMMKPESADLSMPPGKARLALLCGPTAALSANQLSQSAAKLGVRPKACALTWCMEVPEAASCSAVCIGLEPATSEPPQKRAKTSGGPEGTVRVRHILFRHPQLRQADPMARREGAARNVLEAESNALTALQRLLQDPNQFIKSCKELSDCQSAEQPGQLAGDLGWLARGQQEASFEEVAFGLPVNSIGDLVSTSRGVHIIQRLG
ncbi:unnamed protein product [Durusdinium trenchii]|uniref:peptidylprolyl isomerase n=1 Tax=Durusdinium trenchii TaxID=1381693 RepID=A0ABP0S2I3_9DINO